MGFFPEEWLSIPENLMITDGCGSVSLFEKSSDGAYTGHYFFVVRGKAALKLAKEMLCFFFDNTKEGVLRGLTPLSNLAARWMSRQLGFKGYGVVQTANGPCELFILTRDVPDVNNKER